MFYDIFLNKSKTCPICDSIITVRDAIYPKEKKNDDLLQEICKCKNDCYIVYRFKETLTREIGFICIQDEMFQFFDFQNKAQKRKIKREINYKINYWKNDYRYLTKLLER